MPRPRGGSPIAMKITLEEVERIARLAHLRFERQECDRLRGELDQILAYIDKLGELDTAGVDPATGDLAATDDEPRDAAGSLREDRLLPTLSTDDALANAPESDR